MSQIVSTSKTTVFFGAFAALFDTSTLEVASGVSADDDRWCFIDGLNIKWKIFSDLLAPIMIMALCGTIFILSKFVFRRRIRIGKKKVNFQASALAVFLFVVGKFLDTLFKSISCRTGDSSFISSLKSLY